MVSLVELTEYLDEYLGIDRIPDYDGAHNGLQVENGGSVDRVLGAVDASQAAIDEAVDRKCRMLLVHHGLFWSGAAPLVGMRGRRLRALLRNDIAVYSAHLPLDVHPEIGNNTILGSLIGLSDPSGFAEYEGTAVGLVGTLSMELNALAAVLERELDTKVHTIAKGPPRTSRVAVLTGAGGSAVVEAHAAGADTLVTGEGPHQSFFDAEELEVNVVFAGHYATETLGVTALGEHLAERFDLDWTFFDHPTGL
ncbi:MAG: Nif3-like dinuclear metal center hexameric protein [Gemmatimonadales bacterium]